MNTVLDRIRAQKEYKELVRSLESSVKYSKGLPAAVTGMCDGAEQAYIAALCADTELPVLVITPLEKDAKEMCDCLRACGIASEHFPERDFNFRDISASHEFEHKRLGVLFALQSGKARVAVCSLAAAASRTVPPEQLSELCFTVKPGDEIPIGTLADMAQRAGYIRADMCDGAGMYSVRGGIFDIFPAGAEQGVRIEFFGDEVDTVNAYDPMTQRRCGMLDSVTVIPAREVVPDAAARERIARSLERLEGRAKDSDRLKKELSEVHSDAEIRFADRYMDLVFSRMAALQDYFADGSITVCTDLKGISDSMKSLEFRTSQSAAEFIDEGLCEGKNAVWNISRTELFSHLYSSGSLLFSRFGGAMSGVEISDLYDMKTRESVNYLGRAELLLDDVKRYIAAGYTVDILCGSPSGAHNTRIFLEEGGVRCTEEFCDAGAVRLFGGMPVKGFEFPEQFYACLTLSEDEGRRAARAKRNRAAARKSKGERILSYADLSVGDYVVHANHGIGIYTGLQTLTVDGGKRDFVKIKYAGKDVLYLPCDQLDKLSKYIGAHADDGTLKLNKIGGTEWARSKSRAKTSAKEMARELIALYAERERMKGYAFSRDDDFQEEFEAAFPFDETDGQIISCAEIKQDMEKPCPMDRLLCGDVGFGKTEVAMRAAFKAAMNNKQVAVLVPTTILAMQHYQTFSSRMRGFPVNIELLCRFRTPAQQAKSLARLAEGKSDIVIGTHRLLSSDIKFRDLGLLIVDEEQRFGVAHKEKLKQMSRGVDVLTMTATPIPRTLNMAMSGIRDMSMLEEAPEDRLPVQSYVLEYDDAVIVEAVKRELDRDGQVLYLCNETDRLDGVCARLSAAVPDARVAFAHGKMEREELSDIWQKMLSDEIDVLVSTTIIESGIDVPRANTLIVENADKFGLSQLHQIRGRVGRSNRRAYAYFTFAKNKSLTEIASKRLSAIREYTEFGSGFRIALRDLEIRGAGNVLGAEQHGHMDTVGYDLYMKLLSEAVTEEKGGRVAKEFTCTVVCGKSAYIPERYIKQTGERIAAYRGISRICTEADLSDVTDELIDRYGDMPGEVENLVNISYLRSLGGEIHAEKIEFTGGAFRVYQEPFDTENWTFLARKEPGGYAVMLGARPYAVLKSRRGTDEIKNACRLLGTYIGERNKNK